MLVDPKRSFGPFLGLDLVFIALGIVSVAMLFDSGIEGADAIPPAADPIVTGFGLLLAVVLASWIAVLGSKLDQRMNDEFVYKAVTHGAVASLMVGLLLHLVFDMLPTASWGFGDLSKDRLLAILLASWSMAYAINRVRGTAA